MSRTTIERIELNASVKESRKKAVRLELNYNGETLTLWFRRLDAKATDESETVWSIKKPALESAVEESRRFNEYRNSTYTFAAGSFGVCKNGSYYFKTRGWNYAGQVRSGVCQAGVRNRQRRRNRNRQRLRSR